MRTIIEKYSICDGEVISPSGILTASVYTKLIIFNALIALFGRMEEPDRDVVKDFMRANRETTLQMIRVLYEEDVRTAMPPKRGDMVRIVVDASMFADLPGPPIPYKVGDRFIVQEVVDQNFSTDIHGTLLWGRLEDTDWVDPTENIEPCRVVMQALNWTNTYLYSDMSIRLGEPATLAFPGKCIYDALTLIDETGDYTGALGLAERGLVYKEFDLAPLRKFLSILKHRKETGALWSEFVYCAPPIPLNLF
jgi:hypothetical protein